MHTIPTPLVSICIPTYNRARYLECLLGWLAGQQANYPFEIVISDNASTDDTQQVVEAFLDRLPIAYFRQEANIELYKNLYFACSKGRGKYITYLADDDIIVLESLGEILQAMEESPKVGAAYAPWTLVDWASGAVVGQFYEHPDHVHVPQGSHEIAADLILKHHIFPEIMVWRKSLLDRVANLPDHNAYWAFVNLSNYLEFCDVIFWKNPYYGTVVNYFGGRHDQYGNREVQEAWDRYRGGLEVLLGRARLDGKASAWWPQALETFIYSRMTVGLNLRLLAGRDPIENYHIGRRIAGMGLGWRASVSLADLASMAQFDYLFSYECKNEQYSALVCVGDFPAEVQEVIRISSPIPVEFIPQLDQPTQDHCLYLHQGTRDERLHGLVNVIDEELLARKFPAFQVA